MYCLLLLLLFFVPQLPQSCSAVASIFFKNTFSQMSIYAIQIYPNRNRRARLLLSLTHSLPLSLSLSFPPSFSVLLFLSVFMYSFISCIRLFVFFHFCPSLPVTNCCWKTSTKQGGPSMIYTSSDRKLKVTNQGGHRRIALKDVPLNLGGLLTTASRRKHQHTELNRYITSLSLETQRQLTL